MVRPIQLADRVPIDSPSPNSSRRALSSKLSKNNNERKFYFLNNAFKQHLSSWTNWGEDLRVAVMSDMQLFPAHIVTIAWTDLPVTACDAWQVTRHLR